MVLPVFENSIFPALMQLAKNNRALDVASERVSTGLRVNSVDDDVATYIRGITIGNTISQFESRNNAAKTALVPIDAAISTLETALDTLSTMRKNLTDTLANSDFATGSSVHLAMETAFAGVVSGSNIDGNDLLSGNTTVVTLFVNGANDISVTGSTFTALAANAGGAFAAIATAADASTELGKVDADVAAINGYLSTLAAGRAAIIAIQGADATASLKASELKNQLLSADIERESATLTALQTQVDVGRTVIGLLSSSQRNVLAVFR